MLLQLAWQKSRQYTRMKISGKFQKNVIISWAWAMILIFNWRNEICNCYLSPLFFYFSNIYSDKSSFVDFHPASSFDKDWIKNNKNVMTCYKTVSVHCKMMGLQSKVETMILNYYRVRFKEWTSYSIRIRAFYEFFLPFLSVDLP